MVESLPLGHETSCEGRAQSGGRLWVVGGELSWKCLRTLRHKVSIRIHSFGSAASDFCVAAVSLNNDIDRYYIYIYTHIYINIYVYAQVRLGGVPGVRILKCKLLL